MEAAIPEAYETNAKWCMSKNILWRLYGITDAGNGQPVVSSKSTVLTESPEDTC